MLKDFDIKKEAQGVDKVLIKEFKAIVEVGTVEILFRWTGKGTTRVPQRDTYGPLISAIDVEAGKLLFFFKLIHYILTLSCGLLLHLKIFAYSIITVLHSSDFA